MAGLPSGNTGMRGGRQEHDRHTHQLARDSSLGYRKAGHFIIEERQATAF